MEKLDPKGYLSITFQRYFGYVKRLIPEKCYDLCGYLNRFFGKGKILSKHQTFSFGVTVFGLSGSQTEHSTVNQTERNISEDPSDCTVQAPGTRCGPLINR